MPSDERLRLLVVDDDDLDRLAVRRVLRAAGIEAEVVEVPDADAAHAALRCQEFDCVLLDLRLPGEDGLALLRSARAAGVHTPVVMLTGHGDELTAVEIMKGGASDYIPKSALSPERLERSLRHAIRVHRAERQAHEAQEALRRYAMQLRGLAEAAAATNAVLTEDAVLRGITEHARSIIGVHAALTRALPAAPGAAAIDVVSVSDKYRDRRDPPPPDDALEGALRRIRQPIRLTEAELEARPEMRALAREAGLRLALRGWLVAPLIGRNGQPLGLIHLTDKLAGDFAASDEDVLVQLAQLASIAVENARLFQAAQAASRARDDMIAVVSHDLRNPLNVVVVTATMMLRQLPDDEPRRQEREQLARIKRAADRMNRLIGDLLDVTRIEAGQLAIECRAHDVATLLDEVLDGHQPLAAAKPLRLEGEVSNELPPVWADRDRILQVFSNLIGNAIKFTPPEGRIAVRAEAAGAQVRFSVSDTGPGIASENLPHLFDRYWQARQTAKLGAGLGLFIAKGIVEAHRGQIAVDSTPGVGTTFTFTVPVAPPECGGAAE